MNYFVIVVSKIGRGVSDTVEDLIEYSDYDPDIVVGDREDTEILVAGFLDEEEAQETRELIYTKLEGSGFYYRIKSRKGKESCDDVLMDSLALHA